MCLICINFKVKMIASKVHLGLIDYMTFYVTFTKRFNCDKTLLIYNININRHNNTLTLFTHTDTQHKPS